MRVLAIDTCFAACSAAILDGASAHAQTIETDRGHETLIPSLVEAVLAKASLSPDQIERVAVTIGPGSFTGLRIGVAFARGFALTLKAPCLGISSLEVFASAAGAGGVCVGAAPDPLGAAIAAWREGELILAPQRASLPDAALSLSHLALEGRVFGPSAAQLALALGPHWRPFPAAFPDPLVLALLAQARNPETSPPDPLYLRPPDAKPPSKVSAWT